MNDPSLDPLLAYLRQHSGRYSLEALRQQLLQNGYDPAAVARAIQVYQQESPAGPREQVWPWVLKVVMVNAALVAAGFLGIASGGSRTEMVSEVILLALFGVAVVEFVGGLVLILARRKSSLGYGLLLGFLLSVGLGILVLGGFCVYMISQSGMH